MIVLISNGASVRGSITSALIPCCDSTSAAASDFFTIHPVATMVTSEPSRFTSATPNGITCSPDRKSTRLNSSPRSDLVCRLLLEKKKITGGTKLVEHVSNKQAHTLTH